MLIKPFFSVIVTCYNLEAYIEQCLSSVWIQSYRNFEVICINDGSSDSSLKIIEAFSKKHTQFRFYSGPNLGLERACNLAISLSINPWVVRLDGDDLFSQNFLEKMAEEISRFPAFQFYYCQTYIEKYETVEVKKTLPEFDVEEIFCRGDFLASGTVYNKDFLLKTGGYNTKVKNSGLENYELILKLISSGAVGRPVREAVFYYRQHAHNMGKLRAKEIVSYGKNLMANYGREYQTNKFHPYGLKLLE